MSEKFWSAVAEQERLLKTAQNADDVLRILAADRNPYGQKVTAAPGFFASDGDDMADALLQAGWVTEWSNASYFYAMRAPDGSVITYVEGDVFPGNLKPMPDG